MVDADATGPSKRRILDSSTGMSAAHRSSAIFPADRAVARTQVSAAILPTKGDNAHTACSAIPPMDPPDPVATRTPT